MRKIANIAVAVVLTLMGVGAWECADGASPKSQCENGSRKAEHKNGSTKLYECHNQEWVKVSCYNGTTKTETKRGRTVHYRCEGNSWVRD